MTKTPNSHPTMIFRKPQTIAANLLLLSSCGHAQQAIWGQCGGQGWTGPTTCVSGSTCVFSNDWYSQCLPGPQSPQTTLPVTTQPVTTTPPGTVTTPPGGTTVIVVPESTPSNAKLPNPFTFVGGSPVTSKSQWDTRREEINQLYQRYEAGNFPGKPSTFSATFSSNTLTITCGQGGKTITFTASIKYPSSGTAPYPAIIGYGGGSIPQPAGVAMINYNNGDIAVDGTSHGGGKFYTLYGSSHPAGAEAAWAWGASRIIDALEITSAARINPKRIGVTGCSRFGKGAFMAGSLEPRYALTIPQEAGVSGSGCWRIAADLNMNGQSVEAAGNLASPNTNWLSPAFDAFAKSTVDKLPFDHHMIAGMIAPRGVYIIENLDYAWLGPESGFDCMTAAREIYIAVGATSSMGFSQIGGHAHCAFDSRQQSELTAFVNRFLLDQNVDTNVFRNGGGYTFNKAKWIDWTTPTLQ